MTKRLIASTYVLQCLCALVSALMMWLVIRSVYEQRFAMMTLQLVAVAANAWTFCTQASLRKRVRGTAIMQSIFEPGSIILLGAQTRVPGGLAVVTEVRHWGVVAYMQLCGPMEGINITTTDNRAWFRLKWDEIVPTGGKVP
jgi:hypothetical protein